MINEIEQLENQQFEEANESVMPPEDIVAYNELRSCSDIYRMYSKKQLNIQPDFQRNEVWSNQAKTRFVDSVMKGLPIPSMCISLDVKTQKRLVIDGLQRISTIIHFLSEDENWKMSKCSDVFEDISGKKVSEVKMNKPELYDRFENATIPVTVIRCDYSNPLHMQYLFNIFQRLNSGGVKLNNQEIRNCIYQGNFNMLIKNIAESDAWKKARNSPDNNRHKEDELILRFYAMFENIESYSGNMTSFLNNYMSNNRTISDDRKSYLEKLFNDTLNIYLRINGMENQGVNVLTSVLVGIAKNINILDNKDSDKMTELCHKLLLEPEFSEQNLQDGLGATSKVKDRLNKAIQIFTSND